MRKKFAAKMTALAMSGLLAVSALAGCGNSGDPKGTTAAPGPQSGSQGETKGQTGGDEEVTLNFYAWLDEEGIFTKLAEAYKKDHPNVTINMNFVASADYETKLITAFSGGADIDCFAVASPPSLASYVAKNQVYELDELISSTKTDISGSQATIDATKIDGKIYSLPYKTSSWFVVYNKDVFDAAGVPYPDGDWTWEEYAEIAGKLTQGEGADKVYGSLNFQPTSMWWRVPANTKGAINPLEEDQLDAWLDAAEFCKKLSDDGYQPPYADRAGEAGADYTGAFLTGKYGMMYNGDWVIEMLNSAIADGEKCNYDIAPIPHWEGEKPMTVGAPATLQVAKNAKNPEAAFDFISFCTGAEGAKILLENDYFPAWTSDAIVKEYCEGKTAPEHIEYVVNQTNSSQVPCDPNYNTASNVVKEEVSLLLLGEQDRETTKKTITDRLASEVAQ